MHMEPLPRPPYLDQASPAAAILGFHKEQARHNREQIIEQMNFEAEEMGFDRNFNAQLWWSQRVESARWEDGSIIAIWRDRMRFHERCVKFLTDGGQ